MPPDDPAEPETPTSVETKRLKAPDLAAIAAARPALFPLRITAKYHGVVLEATIAPDGTIRYDEEVFTSLSTAASAARTRAGYAGGGKAATNAWIFWRFVVEDGRYEASPSAARGRARGRRVLSRRSPDRVR